MTAHDSDPRPVGDASSPAGAVVAAGVGPLPRLGEVIRDAERGIAQALAVLERAGEVDPESLPPEDIRPGFVMIRIKSATADCRSALLMLAQIAELDLPPVGSAVAYPARHEPDPPHIPKPSPGEVPCTCLHCRPRVSG